MLTISGVTLLQIIFQIFENSFKIDKFSDEKIWGQNYILKVKPYKIGSSIMRDVIIVHA